MPIYEYKCKKKSHVFEVFERPSDKPTKKCIKCDSPVERLVSSSSFQLKGTGWYETDFKNSDKKPKNKNSGSSKEASACGAPVCGTNGCGAGGGSSGS